MEKRLCNIFWTTSTTNFIDPILESSYEVLPRKVTISTARWIFGLFLILKYYNFCMVLGKIPLEPPPPDSKTNPIRNLTETLPLTPHGGTFSWGFLPDTLLYDCITIEMC